MNGLARPYERSGWALQTVWLGLTTGLPGPFNRSGWALQPVWLGLITGLDALEKLGQAGLENGTDKLSLTVCKELQFFAT